MYASLLISLLAAFVAILGKQWLNRYLRHAGGSVIERCGDRQRKCDGLQEWSFHLFVESLPVMLQIALLLLACGLCRYMASVNTPVAGVLITLTALGVLFYSHRGCRYIVVCVSTPNPSICCSPWSMEEDPAPHNASSSSSVKAGRISNQFCNPSLQTGRCTDGLESR